MAAIIFGIGWLGLAFGCFWCVWLGGFAYIKSPDPTARALAWASVGMYFCVFICTIFWIIIYFAAIATAASTTNYYDSYNYYNNYYYNYYRAYNYNSYKKLD